MEMKKMKQLQECQEHRNYIPDDLFLMIFAKIFDANSLCRLSLLSKRFLPLIALTLTGIRTVTFTIKVKWGNPISNILTPLSQEPSLPFYSITDLILSLFHPSNPIHEELFISLGRFLKQFVSIQSLHIHLLLSDYIPVPDPVFKWRIKFKFRRPKHFLIFSAKSITDYNQEDGESDEDNVKGELSDAEKIWVQEFAHYHMVNAYARYLGLGTMVRRVNNNNVRMAKITDSENYGKIVVTKNKIVELKNPMQKKGEWGMDWEFYYIPNLRLQGSRVVLKEVKIGWMRASFEDEEDLDLEEVIDPGPEEGTVLGEIFKEIYQRDDPYLAFANASYTVQEDIL